MNYFPNLGDPPFTLERASTAVAELNEAGCSRTEIRADAVYDPGAKRFYAVYGQAGNLQFERYWRYWVARGPVPLSVARELYADPIGKESVRADGHCGCPPPEEWVEWVDGEPCVTAYHIDTAEGLALFIGKMRSYTNLKAEKEALKAQLETYGELKSFSTVHDLMDDLNSED
jgi:hypothetical protein